MAEKECVKPFSTHSMQTRRQRRAQEQIERQVQDYAYSQQSRTINLIRPNAKDQLGKKRSFLEMS